jgi:peptide chain release factor 2
MEQQIAELRQRSADAGLWDDPETAQEIMRDLANLEATVETWHGLARRLAELDELLVMAEAEDESEWVAEIEHEAQEVADQLAKLRLEVMVSGRHDHADAILTVYAGAGGTESQDWAEMLLRMYLRWAERRGFGAEIIDEAEGDGAGIKNATVEISGRNAYGYLRSEQGVHRLVRISPFDNAHRRHTSFAMVEVIPDITGEVNVEINPDDLQLDFFKASGHGGQNVQKNSTAVRITHRPSGVVVVCQNERSQAQNRERAMAVLKARLYALEELRLDEERAKLRGEHVTAGWGNQIRSYVLHPYRMVKDLRTGWETGNTTAVLDGDIDGLIEAYLQHMVGRD